MAAKMPSRSLKKECAAILESMKVTTTTFCRFELMSMSVNLLGCLLLQIVTRLNRLSSAVSRESRPTFND